MSYGSGQYGRRGDGIGCLVFIIILVLVYVIAKLGQIEHALGR